MMLIYKIVYNLSYEGLENIPKEGGYIYASNHRSYADPVLITLPVRKRFAYMAKEELFHQNIFFTGIIKMMGAFPVVRGSGDMSVIETSIEKLKSGRNLVIFPEGTRSKDGKVGKGKTGVAMIAAMAGADVIPVGIIFEGKLKFRSKVTVKFGKPVRAGEIAVSEKPAPRELKAVKQIIMQSITELVEG
jgi:1-acyl-sn-glycerol-3-phosphate acyltransferase